MTLGIFLSSGDSFTDMEKYGQADRFKTFYIKAFSKNFNKVYIFSYANETVSDLPKNVYVIPNKNNIHRLLYNFLVPTFNSKYIKRCDVFRAYHLSGTMPSVITRIFYKKPFMFNYGYDYHEFSLIEKHFLQYLFLTIMHPLACLFASKIMAVTKAVLEWTPSDKTVFIPNGVDTKVFKILPKEKNLPRRNKKISLLSIGRLETQKNYKNLLKALKGLNIKMTIIGRGSLKDELINFSKKNNIDLTIIDRIDNTALPKVYNQADIFLLPSLTEGPVKVLLEAMACGLPVIGAKVHGIEEIIEDYIDGLFCSTSVNSIRKKIIELMGSADLRKKLGQNAREKMVKDFNLDKLLQKEINLIKEAI